MWYALHVKARREKVVTTLLNEKGLEVFLPLRRVEHVWATARKVNLLPLFTGYVFCQFTLEQRLSVISTPGVVSVVGVRGVPLPVDNAEIEDLQRVLALGCDPQPFTYLTTGTRIVVARGPLRGVSGMIVSERNHHRLVVSISLLQRAVAVELDCSDVTPDDVRREVSHPWGSSTNMQTLRSY